MLEQIRDIIKKNLPAEIGEQLRSRLEQAEQLEREVAQKVREVGRLTGEISDCASQIVTLKAALAKAGDLDKREAALVKGESNLAVTLAHMSELGAIKRADEIKELVSMIFRVPSVRTTVRENAQVPVPGSDGYSGRVVNTTKETVTETEHTA